jgi:hypothetical protein
MSIKPRKSPSRGNRVSFEFTREEHCENPEPGRGGEKEERVSSRAFQLRFPPRFLPARDSAQLRKTLTGAVQVQRDGRREGRARGENAYRTRLINRGAFA